MNMASLNNAKERTVDEYGSLFKRVDGRFKIKIYSANGPIGSDVIEAWLE